MLATGNKNTTLSLNSRKILPYAIGGKHPGPVGKILFLRQENALIQHEAGEEQILQWDKQQENKHKVEV